MIPDFCTNTHEFMIIHQTLHEFILFHQADVSKNLHVVHVTNIKYGTGIMRVFKIYISFFRLLPPQATAHCCICMKRGHLEVI